MKNPYQRVGKRIRLIRRQTGLTQAQLAERAGLSDNYVGLIERGEGGPTLEALNQIADALKIRLGELFIDGEEEPKNTEQPLKELERLVRLRTPKDAQLLLSIGKRIFECFPIKEKAGSN